MALKFTTPGSVTVNSTINKVVNVTLKSGVPSSIILKGG